MCEMSLSANRGRLIDLDQAVGTILAHDLTEIRPGEFKGPAFRKGHVVREDDLEHLARIGKRHLYVLDIDDGMMHENDAALVLAEALAGEGIRFNPNPSEGKISLTAAFDGLLKVNVDALIQFNMVEGVMCASRHTDTLVHQGNVVAGTRAIPLVIENDKVEEAARVAKSVGGIFEVKPLSRPKAGLIITGNEVYQGLIQDRFAGVIIPKLNEFGCLVPKVDFAPDDVDFIAGAIEERLRDNVGLIVLTGGMSVDPDDVTRLAVTMAGGQDIIYGSAVLPGAMMLLARIGDVPLIGVPACGMFHARTIFDLILPRVLAGEMPTRKEIAALGHGGLCLDCPECRYPVCPFGKAG